MNRYHLHQPKGVDRVYLNRGREKNKKNGMRAGLARPHTIFLSQIPPSHWEGGRGIRYSNPNSRPRATA